MSLKSIITLLDICTCEPFIEWVSTINYIQSLIKTSKKLANIFIHLLITRVVKNPNICLFDELIRYIKNTPIQTIIQILEMSPYIPICINGFLFEINIIGQILLLNGTNYSLEILYKKRATLANSEILKSDGETFINCSKYEHIYDVHYLNKILRHYQLHNIYYKLYNC